MEAKGSKAAAMGWSEDVMDAPTGKRREFDYVLLTPMFFPFAIMMTRLMPKRHGVFRDRLMAGLLVTGLAHGAWLMMRAQKLSQEHEAGNNTSL